MEIIIISYKLIVWIQSVDWNLWRVREEMHNE